MRFDRDAAARFIMRYLAQNPTERDADELLERLEACVEPDGWNAMLRILGTHYPESIFPQQYDEADWGNGPQVVSLLRLLAQAESKLERIGEVLTSDQEARLEIAAILGEPARPASE